MPRNDVKLKVDYAAQEDVRDFLCRMSEEDFAQLKIEPHEYLDAMVVKLTTSYGKGSVICLARTPVRPLGSQGRLELGHIALDTWTRHRLGLPVFFNQSQPPLVTVEVADHRWQKCWYPIRYLWDATIHHPEISTRWQKIALAVTVLGVMATFLSIYWPWGLFGLIPVLFFVWKMLPKA
ncbi:MAG: hypothetical protein ABID84_01030 [Chloroflexota bacterium]